MSTYDITLTDPLKSGFLIPPGAFDGPGGSRANTTLRLYGRGALEWGEAVDEDLVRLAETFAGSSAPLYPLPGQLWMCIKYYHHDSSASATTGWWTYDLTAKAWVRLNSNGVVASAPPANPTIGSYYYDGATETLRRWDTAYKQAAAAWMPRAHSVSNLSGGTPTVAPEQSLLVWDQYTGGGKWTPPLTIASQLTAPSAPQIGTLWYDLTTGKLKIWTGTVWKEILGPTNNGSNNVISGNLDMANFQILNLTSGTIASGIKTAVNGGAVYDYITSQLSGVSGSYLPLTGGTITGNLHVNGTLVSGGALSTTSTLTVGGGSTLGNTSITNLTVSGTVGMGGARVTNIGAPSALTDATTKQYVDTGLTNLSNAIGGINSGNVVQVYPGSGTYKAGDICVVGSNIYIAITAGSTPPPFANWKLVYPAAFL